MNKTFKFVYESEEEACSFDLFPKTTKLKAVHQFDENSRWVPILYQFCKFLEGTGYIGVEDRIIIKDPYGIEADFLFETTGTKEYQFDDEEDEDEDEEDEEKDFQDIKKEIA